MNLAHNFVVEGELDFDVLQRIAAEERDARLHALHCVISHDGRRAKPLPPSGKRWGLRDGEPEWQKALKTSFAPSTVQDFFLRALCSVDYATGIFEATVRELGRPLRSVDGRWRGGLRLGRHTPARSVSWAMAWIYRQLPELKPAPGLRGPRGKLAKLVLPRELLTRAGALAELLERIRKAPPPAGPPAPPRRKRGELGHGAADFDRDEARALYLAGWSQRDLGGRYGVSKATIWRCTKTSAKPTGVPPAPTVSMGNQGTCEVGRLSRQPIADRILIGSHQDLSAARSNATAEREASNLGRLSSPPATAPASARPYGAGQGAGDAGHGQDRAFGASRSRGAARPDVAPPAPRLTAASPGTRDGGREGGESKVQAEASRHSGRTPRRPDAREAARPRTPPFHGSPGLGAPRGATPRVDAFTGRRGGMSPLSTVFAAPEPLSLDPELFPLPFVRMTSAQLELPIVVDGPASAQAALDATWGVSPPDVRPGLKLPVGAEPSLPDEARRELADIRRRHWDQEEAEPPPALETIQEAP